MDKSVVDFTNNLVEYFKDHDNDLYYFHNGVRQNKHILVSETNRFAFYVKISNVNPGFWGVNPQYIKEIEADYPDWFLVLLLGGHDVGYLIPGNLVETVADKKKWPIDPRADYKIHEQKIPSSYQFNSFDDFFSRIVSD